MDEILSHVIDKQVKKKSSAKKKRKIDKKQSRKGHFDSRDEKRCEKFRVYNGKASWVAQVVENPPANAGDDPWVEKIPWRRK